MTWLKTLNAPRRFAVLGAAAALISTLLVAPALAVTSRAPAQAWAEGALVNLATHRCLRATTDRGLHVGTCDGSDATLWIASWYSSLGARMQNVETGTCLDDSNDFGLRTFTCQPNGSPYQKYQSWRLSGMVPGNYYIDRYQNVATGRCLDDSFDIPRVGTYRCVQHDNPTMEHQAWRESDRTSG